MPYTAQKPPLGETPDQLRARIPGWGADLDLRDRPSVPREVDVRGSTGAHWELPEQQEEHQPRERSVEHLRLTPVFGTAAPLHGVSGAIRRLAYRRWSEARAAHWLTLLAADRVDAVESHLRSFATSRPDQPLTQSGVLGEAGHHPVRSRLSGNRADLAHQPLDPVIVAGPWLAAAAVGALAVRGVWRATRR